MNKHRFILNSYSAVFMEKNIMTEKRRKKKMTIRHMKIFIEVFQCNSITKAANQLHIAQPAVSLAIRELEEYYGVKLFDRISKRIYTTENGKRFYDYALHIVALFEEMEKGMRDWESLGTIRIGASVTIGNILLPKLIKQFYNKYPKIEVSVEVKNTNTIAQEILDNQIDIGLIEGTIYSPQIEQIPFREDKLCLICGKTHALAQKKKVKLKETAEYNFLFRESGSAGRDILESIFLRYQISVKPIWESISTQAIINAVKEGLGIAILPYLLVEKDIKQKNIAEVFVEDVDFSRKFFIIYHKHKYLTESVKTWIDLCRKIGKKDYDSL